jgi:class 3 adenylate cyclase
MQIFGTKKPAVPQPFTGIGTVLICDTVGFTALSEGLDAAGLAKLLNSHLGHITAVIEKHGGYVIQTIGDAVVALWRSSHGKLNHAQQAYDTAHALVQTTPKSMRKLQPENYALQIVLGTGEMAGDYFGPIKQFQVVGTAMIIADRLSRFRYSPTACITMSQYTFDLIQPHEGIAQTGTIARPHLEELRVYRWTPAQTQ